MLTMNHGNTTDITEIIGTDPSILSVLATHIQKSLPITVPLVLPLLNVAFSTAHAYKHKTDFNLQNHLSNHFNNFDTKFSIGSAFTSATAGASGFSLTSVGGIGFLTDLSKSITYFKQGEPTLGIKSVGNALNSLSSTLLINETFKNTPYVLTTVSNYLPQSLAAWIVAAPYYAPQIIAIGAIGFVAYTLHQATKSTIVDKINTTILNSLKAKLDAIQDPNKVNATHREILNLLTLVNAPDVFLKFMSSENGLKTIQSILSSNLIQNLQQRSPKFHQPIAQIIKTTKIIEHTNELVLALKKDYSKWVIKNNTINLQDQTKEKLIANLHQLATQYSPEAREAFFKDNPDRQSLYLGAVHFFAKSTDPRITEHVAKIQENIFYPLLKAKNEQCKTNPDDAGVCAAILNTQNTKNTPKPVLFSAPTTPPGALSFMPSSCCSLLNSWASPMDILNSIIPSPFKRRSTYVL